MFIDEAIIHCEGGWGGNGCQSLDRGRPGHFKATGGDGGSGGAIILEARENIQTLLDFKLNPYFTAQDGAHGGSNFKTGRRGADRRIGVPAGTEVYDNLTGELMKDLDAVGASVIVCRGGQPGHGNDKKRQATSGQPGESKDLLLKLKLIADVGIIGYPNAGKSTLLCRISNAKSKIAAYPFTTKHPILGVIKFDDGMTKVVADIPGIIEGAHEGKGLGIEFLKHVERTKVLLHMIDFAAVDGRDPLADYAVINRELKDYSPTLAQKPQILVANKIDVPQAAEYLASFKKKVRKKIYPISAVTGEGLKALFNAIRRSSPEEPEV